MSDGPAGAPLPASALVFHADDFGLTPGVNAGILAAYRAGPVRSASLMVTTPGFDEAVTLARQHPGLDLGLHLNLTAGVPCLPPATIPSLVDRAGRFHPLGRWLRLAFGRRLEPAEVAAELTAQAERALATGLPFSHLDSHHHIHLFAPALPVVAGLARRLGLPVVRRSDERRLLRASPVIGRLLRVPPLGAAWRRQWLLALATRRAARALAGLTHADYFGGLPLLGAGLDAGQLQLLVAHLPPGTIELMCHPGYGDAALATLDPGAAAREREVALLTNPALLASLRAAGVALIRSADLARPRPAAPPTAD
jgi:predicted glycoside hydrolase/deacetylase ChbG (UPF0249 family)